MKKILILGGCGFVGSNLCKFLQKKNYTISSLDNLYRKGSIFNCRQLKKLDIKNYKMDISSELFIKKLPKFDFIIDCCAEPAVESSQKSLVDARRVYNTNLSGTFNIIQKSIIDKSKLIFLSTSRVYSIKSLRNLIGINLNIKNKIFKKISINEKFDTSQPKSLYGFTKLASEDLIKEYNYSHNLKYIINRFGLIAGPGQFGKTDQGLVSLWSWKYLNKSNITYIGFGGHGNQTRDVLHVHDLCEIIHKQVKKFNTINNITFNISGGLKNSISLKELSFIFQKISGNIVKVKVKKLTSLYDIPYYVGNNGKIKQTYGWEPKKSIMQIAQDVYNWQLQNFNRIKFFFDE